MAKTLKMRPMSKEYWHIVNTEWQSLSPSEQQESICTYETKIAAAAAAAAATSISSAAQISGLIMLVLLL